jgi:lipoprotein-anchoring transpeptidase ErfK/SrfK
MFAENRFQLPLLSGVRVPHLPAEDPHGHAANPRLTRRLLLTGLGATALSACSPTLEMPRLEIDDFTTGSIPMRPQISIDKAVTSSDVMYASFSDEGFVLPAIPYQKVQKEFRRQIVVDPTGEQPGTIVVKLSERFLYYVLPGGEALRYGVGIGRDGFRWSGRANIQYGKKWPVWTPPPEMIARKPELEKWRHGQPGGLDNPLGARAMYIYKDGQDTGYRVHGSPEWWTIGQAMSSGCVRMINQDVIDLFNRVSGKSPIVVG